MATLGTSTLQAQHQAAITRQSLSTLRSISGESRNWELEKAKIDKNYRGNHQRANQVGSINCICAQERRTPTVLRRRLQAKCWTRRDSYLIPWMDERIDSLGQATVLSTLFAGKDKTALTSHHGFYFFVCMSFGLRIAPHLFQRTVLWK